MQKKFILNFAPTGMIPTKEMTGKVPVEPGEVIEQVVDACQLGITMVHLHARDPSTGQPTHRKGIYKEIIEGIRDKNRDLIICVSTSGRNFSEFEKRSEVLELDKRAKPDFGSLTLSSLNFNRQASINSPQMIQDLAKKMTRKEIKPELEAFDIGMINYSKYLLRKGFLTPPLYFNLILGNIACAQANLLNLGLMVNELPSDSIWSVGGVGDCQLRMNSVAIASGAGVRVGLEDNIWYDEQRTCLASNRDLIERILNIARSMGREPYTPSEPRELFQI